MISKKEDEEQIAWCNEWYAKDQIKKENRKIHLILLKFSIRQVVKHIKGYVKGSGFNE